MSYTYHIANTHFELELAGEPIPSLHSAFLQLQFLPCLYASPLDTVLVSHLPGPPFSCQQKLHLLDSFAPLPGALLETWAPSQILANWAKEKGLRYSIPPWDVVRHVNSKLFSFSESPKLPHAAVLQSEQEVRAWMHSFEGPKVLKTFFGMAGQGHLFLPENEGRLSLFLKRALPLQGGVIGEPWVSRVFDFSTQWFIHPSAQIEYLGTTRCVNNARGKYARSIVDHEEILFQDQRHFLEEHQQVALPILKKMASLGFFGNVGVDAMVYDQDKLQPIVEINARKTMGWVALKMFHVKKRAISLSYGREMHAHENLLPCTLLRSNEDAIELPKKLLELLRIISP